MERLTIEGAIEHSKEVARKQRWNSKYTKVSLDERYNKPYREKCIACAEEHEQLAQWLEELKEYKNLEEQGRILKLPCKSGQKVYIPRCIDECKYDFECPFEDTEEWSKCTNDEPCENAYKVYKIAEPAFELKMLAKIGTRIFLTREEAEAKLNEMKGE